MFFNWKDNNLKLELSLVNNFLTLLPLPIKRKRKIYCLGYMPCSHLIKQEILTSNVDGERIPRLSKISSSSAYQNKKKEFHQLVAWLNYLEN